MKSKPAQGARRNRWLGAVRHLKSVDPRMARLIERVGPCRLHPRPHRFTALVRSILSQQISSKAAESISNRLHAIAGDPFEPGRVIELGETGLRSAGLSGQKARYVLNLAAAVAAGQVPLEEIDESWDDEAVIEALTTIKGIGEWTAQMFLIFVLNRPDVLPCGDLGIRAGLRSHHGLAEIPRPSECPALAEAWRPYRTVASWYLWAGIDLKVELPPAKPPRGTKPARPKTVRKGSG